MTVAEFENQVWETEKIFLIIRACRTMETAPYLYQRMAKGTTTIAVWKRNRLDPLLNGLTYEIIAGDLTFPHGNTNLESVRSSYY